MKRVALMFLSTLNPAGGVEQYVVSVLPELRRLGTEIVFATGEPTDPDNQYAWRLRSEGIEIHYPHIGPVTIRGWSWVVDSVLFLLFPLTLILVAADMLLRRRRWSRAYDGLRGRLNDVLGRWLPDWSASVPTWIMMSWLWMRYRPDVLHVLRADSVTALEWGVRRGVPTVYTEALEPDGNLHYPQMRRYYQRLEDVIPQVSAVITQSERVRRSIERRWQVESETHVLPWVVDVPSLAPAQDRAYHDGRIVFGSAGRLSPEKDLVTFLKAARLLLDQYPERVAFIVAGSGVAESDLKAYACDLHLGTHLRFTGAYSHDSMSDIFAAFDVFVISSLTEGAPLAVMEAMAYDKPVVATDVAGTGELVIDDQTGFLVQSDDPVALARACAIFIENPERIGEMGRNARLRFEACYAPQAGAAQLVDLYAKLIKKRQVC